MPIYDYACDQCGHRFEARQSFSDEPLTSCPECQGHIRRVIHPSGIIFKGSGWYITDSRKSESATTTPSSAPSEAPAASESSADSSSTAATKTESKTESKPAADD